VPIYDSKCDGSEEHDYGMNTANNVETVVVIEYKWDECALERASVCEYDDSKTVVVRLWSGVRVWKMECDRCHTEVCTQTPNGIL